MPPLPPPPPPPCHRARYVAGSSIPQHGKSNVHGWRDSPWTGDCFCARYGPFFIVPKHFSTYYRCAHCVLATTELLKTRALHLPAVYTAARANVDMKATLSTLARWTPLQSGVCYKRVKPCKRRGKSLEDTPQKLCVPLLLRRCSHLALSAEAGAMFVSALLCFPPLRLLTTQLSPEPP